MLQKVEAYVKMHLEFGYDIKSTPKDIIKCLELIEASPENSSGKPNEVNTELTENGISCTNINKLFDNIQIIKSLKSLV